MDLFLTYESKKAGVCGSGYPSINNVAFTQSNNQLYELFQQVTDPAYFSQQHFHPNINGQKLARDAIAEYLRTSARPLTADGIPVNPAPIATVGAVTTGLVAPGAVSGVSPDLIARMIDGPSLSADAPTERLNIEVLQRPCERTVGVGLDVEVFGGAGTRSFTLERVIPGPAVAAYTLSLEGITRVMMPVAVADTPVRLVDPVSGSQSDLFLVPSKPFPCSVDDYTAGPAGASTVLSVLDNDGANAVSVQQFRSDAPWITLTAGGTIIATPPLHATGSYTFRYDSCTAAGGCSPTVGNFDVQPPTCTIRQTVGTAVITGTDGPDVICADSVTDEIQAGGGDDIVIVDSPVIVVDSGTGNDTIVSNGVVILTTPDEDQLETEWPILRFATGSGQTLPTVPTATERDKTPPTISINAPATVERNTQATATITCKDNGGIASCPANVTLDTATVGDFTQFVTATDASENATTVSFSYSVVDTSTTTTSTTTTLPSTTTSTTTTTTTTTTLPPTTSMSTTTVPACRFGGFFAPIDNTPTVNRVKCRRSRASQVHVLL